MIRGKPYKVVCGLFLLAVLSQGFKLTGRALTEDCDDTPPGSGSGSGDPCTYDDVNCAQWNTATCECVACNSFACHNPATGLCENVDVNCHGFICLAEGGEDCTGCYEGFELVDGECVESGSNPPGSGGDDCDDTPPGSGDCVNEDALCNTFNYDTCSCDICSYRSCPKNGLCTAVSDQCKDWACGQNEGYCTCCYSGFELVNRECVAC